MPPGLLDSLKLHSSTSTSTVLRNACTYSIVTLIREQVIRVEEWDCKKEGQWEGVGVGAIRERELTESTWWADARAAR